MTDRIRRLGIERDLIVYHAYDANNNAAPTLPILQLAWDAQGWPSIKG
jgi:arabinan endo-1,5-alpha-L-arabinosidase